MYNAESTVEAAVNSVLGQTYENLELVAVDDGSRDNTIEVLRAIEDSRISVVATSHRGVARARRSAWQVAQGEYMAIMDADDICDPGRIEAQVEVLGAGFMACSGRMQFFRKQPGDHHGRQPELRVTQGECVAEMFRSNPIANNAMMFDSRALARVDDFYRQTEVPSADYALWSRLLTRPDFRFVNIDALLIHYRMHDGQLTKPRSSANATAARKVRESLFGLLGMESDYPGVVAHCDYFARGSGRAVSMAGVEDMQETYSRACVAAASHAGFDQRQLRLSFDEFLEVAEAEATQP